MSAALVLLAALLHASWNAILRGGRDRLWSITVINLGMSLPALVALPWIKSPATASWPFVAASGILHIAYNVSLVRLYRLGDLGETYPIARGSSPMLVALGAAVLAGERPHPLAVAGIVLVSSGILGLGVGARGVAGARLSAALTTGTLIAAYTIVDGLGVRVAASDIGYIAWMFACELAMLPIFLAVRGARGLKAPAKVFAAPLVGGVISFVAYGLVIEVLASAPMGPVSALRETSVIFAALIGWAFLKEPLTMRRMIACIVIACGAIAIGAAR